MLMQMKKNILILVILVAVQLNAQPPDENVFSYTLVFEDDFDTLYNNVVQDENTHDYYHTDVDTSKWESTADWYQTNYLITCDLDGDENKDTIYDNVGYRMKNFENAEIDTTGTGIIKLITKKEDYLGCYFDYENNWDVDTQIFSFTTQMLWSRQAYKYGYFEIRFRLPYSDNPDDLYGIGANLWLYERTDECEKDWCEIDVFEYDGSHVVVEDETEKKIINYYSNNVHYRECQESCSSGCVDTTHYTSPFDNVPEVNFSDNQFHVMAVKWLPDEISFYVDNVKIRTFTTYPGFEFSPSMYVPLNMYVDMNVFANNYCHLIDEDKIRMPYIYEIDYIRVWSISRCNIDYETCELNTNQYNNNDIYNTITIGSGNNCQTTIETGETVTLQANKYIHLKKGFHAKQGSMFHAKIIPCDSIETETQIYQSAE